jgi:TrmH family RNA methyltransferase
VRKSTASAKGCFSPKGLRIMTEAREAGFLPVMLFRCADRDAHSLEIVLEGEVLAAGGDVIETSADILSKLSGKDNAQTVIGVYREHPTALSDIDRNSCTNLAGGAGDARSGQSGDDAAHGRRGRCGRADPDRRLHRPLLGRGCACEHGRDLSRKRSCNAAGQNLSNGCGVGRGSLWVPACKPNWTIRTPAINPPCFILTGNEAQGMPADYAAECDLLVKMPMRGKADSLNAAVATAVMAYEVLNQFRRT